MEESPLAGVSTLGRDGLGGRPGASTRRWWGQNLSENSASPGSTMSGEADPFGDEPEGQDAVDAMNEEIRARHAGRPPAELIAAYDDSYDRLMRALDALPEAQLRSADAYPWTEGRALIDVPFTGHLHEEHVPDVRARLDRG